MNRSTEISEATSRATVMTSVTGMLPPATEDVSAFNDGLRRLNDEYASEIAGGDRRFDRPSEANAWLANTSEQLAAAYQPLLPEHFEHATVLEQIRMAGEMQRRVMHGQTILSLTQAALKGVQKAGEAILNQKG